MIWRRRISILRRRRLTYWMNREIWGNKRNNKGERMWCLIRMDLWLLRMTSKRGEGMRQMSMKWRMRRNKLPMHISTLRRKSKVIILFYLSRHCSPGQIIRRVLQIKQSRWRCQAQGPAITLCIHSVQSKSTQQKIQKESIKDIRYYIRAQARWA